MSLPFPCDFPLLQIMQYNGTSPPFVPMVYLHPRIEPYKAYIASAVANEAGAKASANQARMFTYNALSAYNWNNPGFSEVVQLVGDATALKMLKGSPRPVEVEIEEATQQVLTLYSSLQVMQQQDLRSVVHPSVLSAAHQNVPQLDNLKREIALMNQGQGNNWGNPNMHGNWQGNMPGHPHMVGHSHQMHGGMYPPHMHGGMYPQHHGGYPPHVMQQQQFSQSHMPVQGNQQPVFRSYGNNGGQTFQSAVAQDDPMSSRFASRPVQAVEVPTSRVQEQVKTVLKNQTSELTTDKGTEMDRARHQLTYFGQSFKQDLQPRMDRFQKSAEAISTKAESIKDMVHPDWVVYATLEEAVRDGHVKQVENRNKSGMDGLYRCFVIVPRAFVSSFDLRDYWKEISSASSFDGISKKVKAIAMSLEQKKTQDNMAEVESILNFLTFIDVKMTSLVNDFLRVNLELKKANNIDYVTIDSFVEDVSDMPSYLLQKRGEVEASAFKKFEEEVCEIIGEDLDEKTSSQVYADLFDNPVANYPLVPENYSITHIFLNSLELGYRVNKEPQRISRKWTPTLYSIIESLEKHKREMSMATLYDLLVTADGVTYKIYRDYRTKNEYLISM